MDNEIIKVCGLWKAFGGHEVLRGVDLSVPEGRITTIIGKSGTGKSVLLKNIIGILKPDRGEIFFEGRDLTKMKDQELLELRRGIFFRMPRFLTLCRLRRIFVFRLSSSSVCVTAVS